MKNKKAFTMVELIIVIIILAVLLAIGIVSYNGSQASSRDAKRKGDVNTFVMAMTIYKVDKKTVEFISTTTAGNPSGEGFINKTYPGRSFSIAKYLTDGGYLEGRVEDPKYKADNCTAVPDALDLCQDYTYFYNSASGGAGTIYAKLENSKFAGDNDRTAAPDAPASCVGCADFATVMANYQFAKIIK